jgi:hypothetical protein
MRRHDAALNADRGDSSSRRCDKSGQSRTGFAAGRSRRLARGVGHPTEGRSVARRRIAEDRFLYVTTHFVTSARRP